MNVQYISLAASGDGKTLYSGTRKHVFTNISNLIFFHTTNGYFIFLTAIAPIVNRNRPWIWENKLEKQLVRCASVKNAPEAELFLIPKNQQFTLAVAFILA